MTESLELRPSPAKRLIVALVAITILVGAGVFVVLLLRSKAPNPACDHVAELAKTNPRDAENFVGGLVHYVAQNIVEVNLVNGKTSGVYDVDGDTPDERCRSAMSKIEKVLSDVEYRKIVDCLTRVVTSRDARSKCLGE